jgi:hypothetical protein
LADCLVKVIAGEDTITAPIDPAAAALAARARLAEQLADYGVGDLPVQIRLRTLFVINAAIKAYHEQHGAYPLSDKTGDWGMPQGLVPKFLKELPIDPVAKGGASYGYWSDGAGYKLVSFAPPDDCTFVSAYWLGMIDMSRVTNGDPTLCKDYGYWTADQATR